MICKCETLNITEKNDEQIIVTVMRGFDKAGESNESEGTPQAEPFPVEISTDIDVKLTTPRAQRLPVEFSVGTDGKILVELKADRVKAGTTYGLEVTGVVNGSKWCAIGDSIFKITRSTERGPKQVKVDADPYEVTLWAGYVGDVIPRHLRDLAGFEALSQLLENMVDTLEGKANTEDVTNALKAVTDRFANYVPTSQKGQANGVAALDAAGKLLASQLNMPWRGNFEGGFQDSNVAPGIWGIDGRRIGPNPLHGEDAHGVMLVFPDRYKTTVFLVAPPRDSQYGTAPEIYARRWMPAANSWTSWLTTADFLRRNEVDSYTLAKNGNYIQLRKNGELVNEVLDANTTYSTMSQAEAEAGTATSARTMSAKILKAAIEKHTEDKPSTQIMNQAIQHAMESLDTSNLTEITHGELVLLRNAGGLVPGRNYRITDFVTITNSAGLTASIPFTSDFNPFDLIVTATSASTLSEDARVILHEGNTYFKNCNLSAWQIKYSLDNDVQRFSWASTESGKGVIYWMRDEFGNEAPYDFKNILFKRKVNTTGHSSATGADGWCFTFNYFDQLYPVQVEHNGHDMTVRAAGDDGIRCFGNKVQAFCNYSQKGQATHALPNIVLLNASGFQVPVCANNIFGVNCRTITLNPQSKDNVFGGECQQIELGAYARHNVIGNYCCYIAGGYALYYNNIGAGCWNIDIGEYARQLTFHSSVLYASTPAGTSSSYVKNCEVMGGSYGNSSEKGAIPFAAAADYPQVAYKAQDGSIKVADASSESAMPLTRATDTLLNPNECLEPGIYENVEFPEIELDPLAELGDIIGAGTNSTNGTMLVGMEGSADGNRIVQQVIVKSSWSEAVSLMVPTGSYTNYSNFAAHIAVRSIRISKGGVWIKGTPDSVTLNPDGTSTVIPGTPDRYEEFNSTHFGEWVPMASFAHIKSLVEAIRANFALKSDTLAQYKVGEEVLVGEWTEDGVAYDLYRKVVSFGNLPNAGQKTVEHGIGNKVKIVRVSGITSDGRPLPLVTHDPDKGIYLAVGGTYVTIQTGATDRSSLTADVTIEFTRAREGNGA